MISIKSRINPGMDGCIPKRFIILIFGALLAVSLQARAGDQAKASGSRPIVSGLRPYAFALGQRLLKSGRQRVVAGGTISSYGNGITESEPVRILWQYPNTIGLEHAGNSFLFDRNDSAQALPKNQKTAAALQMLLEDTVEGFLKLQESRMTWRFLGSGFRLESARALDPAMDVAMISYPDRFRKSKPVQKIYCFNSRTKLLGLVIYASPEGVPIHVVVDDWRDVGGEKLPFQMERWDNNKLTLQIKLESATISDSLDAPTLGGK